MTRPVYTLDEIRFEIDSCLPQLNAVKNNSIEMHALTHGNYPGKELRPDQLAGISSMGFMHIVGEQSWAIEPHRNEGIEICFQENGSNTLIVDGNKYKMPAKTLTVTRPWQLHQMGDPYMEAGRLHWIILDVGVRRPNQTWTWPDWCILTTEDLHELERLLRGNENPAWQANNYINDIFKRIQTYVISEPVEQYLSHLKIHLNQLLLALLELLKSQNIVTQQHLTTKTRAVEMFLEELKSNYKLAAYDWTLQLMANYCGMERSAFSNYCQQLTNTSPIIYLNQCRLQHACNTLRKNPQSSITDLAIDLGFSSSQYFSRCFKEKFSLSPKQWVKKHNDQIK
ncbi:helix-turn-helix transcriptional regulator [Catenovulum sediminis]|uniref:AraC family transcriptional regulator n=1 Tax=Catenovulum sediminis TaxID=1740262 RepID=A0ABV1RF85_9ALTE